MTSSSPSTMPTKGLTPALTNMPSLKGVPLMCVSFSFGAFLGKSAAAKCRLALGVEGFDAFAEIVGLAQSAVAMAFQFDRGFQVGVLGGVEQRLGGALRERREAAQFVDQSIRRRFELVVRYAFGGDAPVVGLLGRNALASHHDVLGAGDADDLLQPRRTARARDLAEPLLRQGVKAGLRDEAEVAGERNLEADAEAVAAIGDDHRLGAARRRGDVPIKLGDVLGRGG